MSNNMYSCTLCELEGKGAGNFLNRHLVEHLSDEHQISLEEYCYRHLEGKSEWPSCAYEKCNNGENGERAKVQFYKLSFVFTKGSAFAKYCCRPCQTKDAHLNNVSFREGARIAASDNMKRLNEGQWASEEYREQARERSSRTIQRQWQTEEFREIVTRTAVEQGGRLLGGVARRLKEFQKSHEGRGPYEDILWKHPRFQALRPIHNDKRYCVRGDDGRFVKQYMLDFYVEDLRLCVEVDGWSHKKTKDEDAARDRYLLDTHGVAVIRVTNEEVEKNIELVVDEIHNCALAIQLYS